LRTVDGVIAHQGEIGGDLILGKSEINKIFRELHGSSVYFEAMIVNLKPKEADCCSRGIPYGRFAEPQGVRAEKVADMVFFGFKHHLTWDQTICTIGTKCT